MPPPARFAAVALAAATACTSPPESRVSGQACIVFDVRYPRRCATPQVVDGLTVVDQATGASTLTDGQGYYHLDVPAAATSAVIEVGAGRDDRRPGVVVAPALPAHDLVLPVVASVYWSTFLAPLGLPADDPSRATIHVEFPAPGALIGAVTIGGASQVLFNQGDAFRWASAPPMDQSFALLAFGVVVPPTGVVPVEVRARNDAVLYQGDLAVVAGAITWLTVAP